MNADIFKAYDIRGRVGEELTEDICWTIGKALADNLPAEGAVAVGYDMRRDSKELAGALSEGLRLQGRDVVNIGRVSTDMMYFAVGSLGLAGGAVVTASHNPGEYNGIKLCRESAKPIGIESGLAEIRDATIEGNFVPAAEKGELAEKDIRADWINHLLGFVDAAHWPEYRIAIDAGNGMIGAIAPILQQRLPKLRVRELYYELDGTYPNHAANPHEEANLADLQRTIREDGLDFGIAFDGDGDRAVLVDERGETVSGTVMTAILAGYFLVKHPGSTILYNAICGQAVPETIEMSGGTGIRTKVGHSYIKAAMREHDAIFAGEHSGHYYFRDNWSADSGLLAAMIAIQVLAESGATLSQLAARYKRYEAIPEASFEIDDKAAVIERLRAAFADGEQDDLDGLTVEYPDGWFNVRASNTEPLLRLNAEANDKASLDALVDRVVAVIKK